jgi:hypothetical protein
MSGVGESKRKKCGRVRASDVGMHRGSRTLVITPSAILMCV